MNKIIVVQGIPGSGKTFWARKWILENPEHRVRFNRDDIRNMLGKYWVPKRESLINRMYETFIDNAMLSGYDIVLDNMNLSTSTLNSIKETVKCFNERFPNKAYEIEYKSFLNTPLEVCIERDSKRENPIGEETIREIHQKYKKQYNL